jgi:hypothetical protein
LNAVLEGRGVAALGNNSGVGRGRGGVPRGGGGAACHMREHWGGGGKGEKLH